MKHLTVFVMGLALAIFLLGANAKMQQDTANLLRDGQQTATSNRDAYISDNSWHKLIINANDQTTYNQLRSQGAIISEINYGSFRLVVVDEQALGGKAAVQQLAASVRDDFDLISLNGYVLDTTNPAATYNQLPTDLRKIDMADAIARGTKPAGGLYIIQFAGPIQDAWLDALKATGVKLVTYIPSNAYLVRGNSKAALALIEFAKQNRLVQFIGDYEPSFKLSPGLRAARENSGEVVDVTAQVIGGPGAKQTIANISAMAEDVVSSFQAPNYHTIELRVRVERLAEMARYNYVFVIEERRQLDESQDQSPSGRSNGPYKTNSDDPAQPSIEASPASFSFSATAGGANPANQYLSITNTGGGTLHWSASDDVPWLTLTTTTGTAPAAVTLAVNIAGLKAGTCIGIITITDASAANSPVWITVTLTVSGNFLSNPGFESGNTTWVATPDVITNDSGQAAHGGTWKAWLNGTGITHTDTLRQMVPIPSTATTVTLRFWLHIDSAETTTSVPFDKLQVQIRNSTGTTVLATLATFSNLNRAAGYSLKSFDVTAFKGQTVSVYFFGTEDQVLQTSFVIDDVALNVQY